MKRKTLPNQKVIHSHKKEKYTGTFMTIGCNELSKAMNELNGSEFRVWLYLMKNQAGGNWILYMVDCIEFTGMSSKSYYEAINELIEKGYLLFEKGNVYGAYDIPVNSSSVDEQIPEESSSIKGVTQEESTRQLSSENFLEIPVKSSRENNTNNNIKEHYNEDANASVDATLVPNANADGFYLENDQTDTFLTYALSKEEVKKLEPEDRAYEEGIYNSSALEIKNTVLKKIRATTVEKDGKKNAEVFNNKLDYALVLEKLLRDKYRLEKLKGYNEKNALAYHVGIVVNQLKLNLSKERETLKNEYPELR